MKKILRYSFAAILCIALAASCQQPEELVTDQFGDNLTLGAYGPNPVYRDGELTFIGSYLEDIVEVQVPGIDPITTIEVLEAGRESKIKVALTNTTEEVGYIVLVAKDGTKLTTQSELTYTEPIVLDDFTPKNAMPGDVITFKGDYMNLIQEVIFADNVIVAGDDILEKTRYELKVKVPANAITGAVALGDVDQIADPAAYANTKLTKEDLVIGNPTVTANASAAVKSGSKITVKGENLNMIEKIVFDGATLTEFDLASDGKSISFALPATAADGEYSFVSFAGNSFKAGEFESVKPSDLAADPQPVKADQMITITGKDLDVVDVVSFPDAGEAAWSTPDQFQTIQVYVPVQATEGDITLTMANGASVTVPYTLVKPTITEVSPLEIYAGDELTVTGTDLDLIVSATLGGKDVDLVPSNGGESLKLATAATSVSGKVVLTLANGTSVESADEVTVNYRSKVIVTSIPEAEHIGQPVSIEGTNLKLVETIYIGETKVTDYSLRTDSQIVFNMPWCKIGSYPVKFVLYDGDTEVQANPIEVLLEMEVTTIAEGEFVATGWGNQPYVGSDNDGTKFGIKAGDVLRLYFQPIDGEAGWQFQIVEGHWGPTYAAICSKGNNDESGSFTEIDYNGYYDITVTAEMATAFSTQQWWGGIFVLNGDNVKATKLDLIKYIAQEVTLWEGETAPSDWSGSAAIPLDAAAIAKIKAGQTITFYFDCDPSFDYWQVEFCTSWWTGIPSLMAANGGDRLFVNFEATDTKYSWVLTQDDVDQIAAQGGFLLCGNGVRGRQVTVL